MHYDAVDWDDEEEEGGNTRHIAANGVSPNEFEEVLDSIHCRDVVSSHSS